MRIGFDAKRLFHNDTGLGVYSRQLVEGLSDAYPEHQYVLFAGNVGKSDYSNRFSDYEIISSSRPLWRSYGMSRDIRMQKCDIFHGLSHELPMGIDRKKVRTVVTIHDLIFKVEPELFPYIDRKIYDLKWKHSCRVADVIVSVSEHTKADLCKFYGVDANKIIVVPPAVSLLPSQRDEKAVLRKYRLPPRFHLYVGSLTKRKNVISILRAMSMQHSDDRLPLVVVGKGPEKQDLLDFAKEEGISEEVYLPGYVDEEDLGMLYRLAYSMIYPSFYEGFGLPIVESLLSKTPVITSNVSSMPEAAGPGGILVDPSRPDEIAHAMSSLIHDQVLYGKLVTAGYEHALQFSPSNLCSRMMQIYADLI